MGWGAAYLLHSIQKWFTWAITFGEAPPGFEAFFVRDLFLNAG